MSVLGLRLRRQLGSARDYGQGRPKGQEETPSRRGIGVAPWPWADERGHKSLARQVDLPWGRQKTAVPGMAYGVKKCSAGQAFVFGELIVKPGWQHGLRSPSAFLSVPNEGRFVLTGDLRQLELTPCDALFFDCETSGLQERGGALAFLVGTLRIQADGTLRLRQYLLRSVRDEWAALKTLKSEIDEARFLVSFNGKAFDRNVLADRFVRNRLDPSLLLELPHLDLLHPARRLFAQSLRTCSLSTIEQERLGVHRPPDEVYGAEVPAYWERYLATGDREYLFPILKHNLLDLLSLPVLAVELDHCLKAPTSTLPDPAALLGAAKLLILRGDSSKAESVLRLLVDRTSCLPSLRYRASWELAELLRRQGRFEESLSPLASMCRSGRGDGLGFDLKPWRAYAIALDRRLKRPKDALELVNVALGCLNQTGHIGAQEEQAMQDLQLRKARLEARLRKAQVDGSVGRQNV